METLKVGVGIVGSIGSVESLFKWLDPTSCPWGHVTKQHCFILSLPVKTEDLMISLDWVK